MSNMQSRLCCVHLTFVLGVVEDEDDDIVAPAEELDADADEVVDDDE